MTADKNQRRILVLIAAAGIVAAPLLLPEGARRISGIIQQMFDAGGTWAGAPISVPVWLLALTWAVVLTAIGAAMWRFLDRREKAETPRMRATTAEVLGMRWRWENHGDEMQGITPFCPKCDRQITPIREARHGFLHLTSFRCECRKWSKSFQCSHTDIVARVCATVRGNAASSTLSPADTSARAARSG